ncbi:hypothetical protein NQZ68_021164 [Dissostichus eleginoides]|nr:hypothetical protein NQZ68_021164 [Dissostichus eleginoides]
MCYVSLPTGGEGKRDGFTSTYSSILYLSAQPLFLPLSVKALTCLLPLSSPALSAILAPGSHQGPCPSGQFPASCWVIDESEVPRLFSRGPVWGTGSI